MDIEVWYFMDLWGESDYEVVQNIDLKNKRLQYAIGSPNKAVKVIAMLLLLAFNNNDVEQLVIEKVFKGKQSDFD